MDKGDSLSIALRASRTGKSKQRTSFLGVAKVGDNKEAGGLVHRSISLNRVVIQKCDSRSTSQSGSNLVRSSSTGKRKERPGVVPSMFGKIADRGQ
jgi:hypothetical protein